MRGRITDTMKSVLPPPVFETLKVRALGLFQIPMILFITPRVIESTDDRCIVEVPLNWRTKNHLGSMYFGALSAGADIAGGLIAWKVIEKTDPSVKLIFKDFHAEFLKRAEGDVQFRCDEGAAIRDLVKRAAESGERVSMPVHITATTPKKTGNEPIGRFILTLSLKRQVKG